MLAFRRIAVLVATALVAAACTGAAATSSPTSTTAPSAASSITIGTASSANFGTVLTGPTGMTLYTYNKDSATSSTCTGDCAAEWPPLVTTGQATLGAGLTGQLGTLMRADGTTQVTYGGHPLYYWEGDTKAGDVTGNGIDGFSVATVGGARAVPAASAPAAAPASTTPYRY